MTNVLDKETLRGMYYDKPSTKTTQATQESHFDNNNNSPSLKRPLETDVKNKVYSHKRKVDVRKKNWKYLEEMVEFQVRLYFQMN